MLGCLDALRIGERIGRIWIIGRIGRIGRIGWIGWIGWIGRRERAPWDTILVAPGSTTIIDGTQGGHQVD